MLPKIAMYGLQIVSPSGGAVAGIGAVGGIDTVAGIDDPGPEVIAGNGGGPLVAGVTMEGNGGGVTRCGAGAGSLSLAGAAGSVFAAGNGARNSEIGFHAAFAWSQARSLALRLPSATFSRMADSEKRPAYCPFRCTQISTPLI